MKKIRSTNGYTILVDDEYYERFSKYSWWAMVQKGQSHVNSVHRSTRVKGKRKCIRIAQEIIGKREGLMIDHINGNALDNRRSNLRFVTNSQNQWNARLRAAKEGRGVHFSKRDNKFCAAINFGNLCVSMGYYSDQQSAEIAYEFASLMLHGEYGSTYYKYANKENSYKGGSDE